MILNVVEITIRSSLQIKNSLKQLVSQVYSSGLKFLSQFKFRYLIFLIVLCFKLICCFSQIFY
jgi:hypothetical protein